MFLLGIILGVVVGMFLMSCLSINTINEKQSLINARTKKLEDAEDEVACLVEENKTLYKENKKQRELLTEVADRVFCCPLDSEKIVLNKIKELVRDYQSEN